MLKRMRGLHAPDDDWAGIRDDYIDLYRSIFALIANDDPPDDAYTLRRGTEIKEREDRLRTSYRLEAASLLQQSRAARILRVRR